MARGAPSLWMVLALMMSPEWKVPRARRRSSGHLPLHVVNAVDPLDLLQNLLEVGEVGDVEDQADFAPPILESARLDILDVGLRVGDDRGDLREHAGAIL